MAPAIIICPDKGSASLKSSRMIGWARTAIPTAQGIAMTMINRVEEWIWVRTLFFSPAWKAAVRLGTQEADMADAMETGTLIRTLY